MTVFPSVNSSSLTHSDTTVDSEDKIMSEVTED